MALPSPELPQLVVAAVPFLRDRDLRIGQSGQGATEIRRELIQGITRRYKESSRGGGFMGEERHSSSGHRPFNGGGLFGHLKANARFTWADWVLSGAIAFLMFFHTSPWATCIALNVAGSARGFAIPARLFP